MNRRQFVLAAAAAPGLAQGQTALPDMLLEYFAGRLDAEAKRWDAERKQDRSAFVREKLRLISGPFPERTPLRAKTLKSLQREGYRIENVVFESRPDFFVNGNLYVPAVASARSPGIVMPRGHFDPDRMSGDYQQICFDLVKSGCVVLSYDPVGQGERRQNWMAKDAEFDSLFSTSLEHALIGNLLALVGESSAGLQVWDGMRAVDYLLTRPEVDPAKIGCADHSDNGSETSLLCAMEERIACAVLHAAKFGHRWPVDRTTWISLDDTQEYLPGAATFGIDICDTFAAVLPRPLLILTENAETGFDSATGHIRAQYRLAGAAEKFGVGSADATAEWPARLRLATVDWFARWFGTTPAPRTEMDVTPELKSALRAPNPGKSVYTLIREKAAAGVSPALRVDDVRNKIRPLAPGKLTAEILNSETVGGLRQDKLMLPSEPGIRLPSTLWHPLKPNGKVVVYVAGEVTALDPQGGDNDAEPAPDDVTAQQLAARGFTVLAVDVRGIGATSPRIPRRGFRVPYHHLLNRDMAFAMMAWSLNDSLFAMRVRDLLRAVDYVAPLGEVQLAGRDMGAAWAIFAAALNPRVRSVITQNGLASWKLLTEHDRYQQASSQFMWAALPRFDLPSVTALIAPRPVTIINPEGHDGKPLGAAAISRLYNSGGTQTNLRIMGSGDIADHA